MNRIDPNQTADRVRRTTAAAGSAPCMVSYDANEIQDFIAASGRPITMRGASEIVRGYDEEVRRDERTIFANGGRGSVIVGSAQEARETAARLVQRYRELTAGGVVAACWVPLELGGIAEAQSIRWMRRSLASEKDAALPPAGEIPATKGSECAYCRRFRGSRERRRDGVVEKVCVRCDVALESGGRSGQPQRGAGRGRGEMSLSLADIAEHGRIAVISADGNNLGVLFDSLHSLVELAVVSEVIAAIFQEAQAAALDRIAADRRLPLVAGGDDVRAFIPPSAVLAYVETLVDAVESAAHRYALEIEHLVGPDIAEQVSRLGVGVGAVIANVYFPAWRLVEYAHVLERSAKRTCRGHWRSAFDFSIVTVEESMFVDPDRTPAMRDIRPLQPRSAAWTAALRSAAALRQIPQAQLGVLASGELDDAAELGNALRYQVARSPAWRAWYETCGVDWRDPAAVARHRPDRGSLALAELLGFQKVAP